MATRQLLSKFLYRNRRFFCSFVLTKAKGWISVSEQSGNNWKDSNSLTAAGSERVLAKPLRLPRELSNHVQSLRPKEAVILRQIEYSDLLLMISERHLLEQSERLTYSTARSGRSVEPICCGNAATPSSKEVKASYSAAYSPYMANSQMAQKYPINSS